MHLSLSEAEKLLVETYDAKSLRTVTSLGAGVAELAEVHDELGLLAHLYSSYKYRDVMFPDRVDPCPLTDFDLISLCGGGGKGMFAAATLMQVPALESVELWCCTSVGCLLLSLLELVGYNPELVYKSMYIHLHRVLKGEAERDAFIDRLIPKDLEFGQAFPGKRVLFTVCMLKEGLLTPSLVDNYGAHSKCLLRTVLKCCTAAPLLYQSQPLLGQVVFDGGLGANCPLNLVAKLQPELVRAGMKILNVTCGEYYIDGMTGFTGRTGWLAGAAQATLLAYYSLNTITSPLVDRALLQLAVRGPVSITEYIPRLQFPVSIFASDAQRIIIACTRIGKE